MPNASSPDHQIGGLTTNDRADALIAALAARQHGVVSRTQLLAAGVTRRQIERRVERRVLRVIHPGVYARARDRKLVAAGWIVVRLTDEGPDDGIADLSRVLGASAARSPRPGAWAA